MDRREANNANVSGWYLGPVGASSAPTENDLELLYSYQLVSLRPALLKILSLPVNYLVVFDGEGIASTSFLIQRDTTCVQKTILTALEWCCGDHSQVFIFENLDGFWTLSGLLAFAFCCLAKLHRLKCSI